VLVNNSVQVRFSPLECVSDAVTGMCVRVRVRVCVCVWGGGTGCVVNPLCVAPQCHASLNERSFAFTEIFT
jgi:hypothetical protein